MDFNPLTPNVNYSGRTAPLTSKVAFYIFIQQIQVLNILNMVYTFHFFSSKCSLFHNYNVFDSCIIHILYTGCAKIKKNYSGSKSLKKLVVRTWTGQVAGHCEHGETHSGYTKCRTYLDLLCNCYVFKKGVNPCNMLVGLKGYIIYIFKLNGVYL